MAETRTEKYRRYRESLNEVKLNNKGPEADTIRMSKIVTDTSNSTTTLPLEEVLGKIDDKEETTSSRMLTMKRIRIAILIIIGILIIAGIIIFAMIAFGGNN
jgi:hypothetical protein